MILISPPFLKKILLRLLCAAELEPHAKVGWFSAVYGRRVKLGTRSVIRPFSIVSVAGDVQLGRYSEISSFSLVYGSSSLRIGDYSYIGPQCIINVEEEVRIGDQSALGPRSMVFTHGSFLPYTEGYWSRLGRVTLGDRVWCAAGVFIHPGVEIGEDTFVNSRSVVKESLPPHSVVEGNPARVICPMERVRRDVSPERVDALVRDMLESFAEIGLKRELGIRAVSKDELGWHFRYRGKRYQIRFLSSTAKFAEFDQGPPGEKVIVVSNSRTLVPPKNMLLFDLPKGRTVQVRDKIHTAMGEFFRRYYGVRFVDTTS